MTMLVCILTPFFGGMAAEAYSVVLFTLWRGLALFNPYKAAVEDVPPF